jgi:hypothetical protein
LFIIASLRYGVGTDFFSYQGIWNGIKIFNTSLDVGYGYLEKGFLYTCALLKYLSTSDFLFFSFYAFITLYFFFKGLKNLNYNLSTGVFLYFCLFYFAYLFNAVRQAVAISLFIFSLKYLFNKQYVLYLFINIIGALFHSSGYLYIIILPVVIHFKKYYDIVTLSVLLIGIVGYKLNFAGKLLFTIMRLLGDEGFVTTYSEVFNASTTFTQLISRLYLLFLMYYLVKNFKHDSIIIFCYYMTLISFVLYLLLYNYNMIATRINMGFRILELIAILEAIKKTKYRWNKFIYLFLLLLPYTLQFVTNITYEDNYYNVRKLF